MGMLHIGFTGEVFEFTKHLHFGWKDERSAGSTILLYDFMSGQEREGGRERKKSRRIPGAVLIYGIEPRSIHKLCS